MEHGEGASSPGGTMTSPTYANAGVNNSAPIQGEFKVSVDSAFSSKGLSEFKPGNTSIFKNPQEFGKQQPIIDISRPVENITRKENQRDDHSKTEFDVQVKVPEKNSIFKNPQDFGKPKPIFDIKNPIQEEPIESFKTHTLPKASDIKNNEQEKKQTVFKYPSEQKENEHISKNEKEAEANFYNNGLKNEQHENALHQPEVIKEAQISSKNESFPIHRVETSPTTQQSLDSKISATPMAAENEVHLEPEVRTQIKTEVLSSPQLEQHTKPLTSSPQIEGKVDVKPEVGVTAATEVLPSPKTEQLTKPLTKVEVESEVAAAQDTLAATLAEKEKISITKAREEIATVVRKEISEQKTEPSTEQNGEQKKNKKTLHQKAREMFIKRHDEIDVVKKQKKHVEENEGILYFERDNTVNKYREMAALASAQRINASGGEVSGTALAHDISQQLKDGQESEIVEGIQDDKTADEVLGALSKIGKIENSWTLRRLIRQITDRFTAVKLVSESRDGAQKTNAENVYGTNLNGVEAKYEEENEYGVIRELKSGQVVFITQKRNSQPVAPGDISEAS